jgi:hypothetical protein
MGEKMGTVPKTLKDMLDWSGKLPLEHTNQAKTKLDLPLEAYVLYANCVDTNKFRPYSNGKYNPGAKNG